MAGQENERAGGSTKVSADSEDRSQAISQAEVLDWDACLETPPTRPSGTVKVRLHFRGRDEPIPVDESEDDQKRAS